MIGDKLIYHDSYKKVTEKVIKLLYSKPNQRRLCIAIGGESGCGKTSLAHALHTDLQKHKGHKGYMFHMDDYFVLPPKDNHNKRLENIDNVGVDEVDLKLLDNHIQSVIKQTETKIEKPLVNYADNSISTEVVDPQHFDFFIVEGTYAMLLNSPDFKIFIKKTYKDTKTDRLNRGRDLMNKFNEHVLEIEHQIVKEHIQLANMTI